MTTNTTLSKKIAVFEEQLKVCEFYIDNLDHKTRGTLLHIATYCDHLDICKLIMVNNSDKNPGMGNDHGTTPLHKATRWNYQVLLVNLDSILKGRCCDGMGMRAV